MNATDNHESPDEPAALADSPWFWVMLFSAVGSLALLAIGPKYGERQSQIERQYQARGQVHRDVAEGRPLGELGQDEAVEYSTPGHTLISLWPLQIAVGIVFLVSAGMSLRRAWHLQQSNSHTSSTHDEW